MLTRFLSLTIAVSMFALSNANAASECRNPVADMVYSRLLEEKRMTARHIENQALNLRGMNVKLDQVKSGAKVATWISGGALFIGTAASGGLPIGLYAVGVGAVGVMATTKAALNPAIYSTTNVFHDFYVKTDKFISQLPEAKTDLMSQPRFDEKTLGVVLQDLEDLHRACDYLEKTGAVIFQKYLKGWDTSRIIWSSGWSAVQLMQSGIAIQEQRYRALKKQEGYVEASLRAMDDVCD